MQPVPLFDLQVKIGVYRAVRESTLHLMPKYFLVPISPSFTLWYSQNAASALVPHTGHFWSKSGSDKGHFNLDAEIDSSPYLAMNKYGLFHTPHSSASALCVRGEAGNRGMRSCSLERIFPGRGKHIWRGSTGFRRF
jgi:hypothetical protein